MDTETRVVRHSMLIPRCQQCGDPAHRFHYDSGDPRICFVCLHGHETWLVGPDARFVRKDSLDA